MVRLTDEDKLLGRTEPKPKTILEKIAFSDKTLYKVGNAQGTNTSIETGETVASILPYNLKRKVLNGVIKVEYNGIVFERIVTVEKSPKQELKQEEEIVKPKAKAKTTKKRIK